MIQLHIHICFYAYKHGQKCSLHYHFRQISRKLGIKLHLVVIEHSSYFLLHFFNQVSLGVLAPIWHLKRCVFFCRILSSFQPESVPGMILLHPMVSLNQTLPVLAPLVYRLAAPSSALRVIFVIVAVRPPASSEASNQSGGVCATLCLPLSLLWSLQWMSLEHHLASYS